LITSFSTRMLRMTLAFSLYKPMRMCSFVEKGTYHSDE